MIDAFQKIVLQARTGDIISAAQNYVALAGGSLEEAKKLMHAIHAQTNWKREDEKEDEQEGK